MRALKWRALVAVLCSAAWPLAAAMPAAAQQAGKIARVGVLSPADSDKTPAAVAFRKTLQELGYVEGKSIVLDFRLAKGHNERLGDLAAELVQIPVDVIVAGGTTAVRATAGITHSIPIIQAAGGDPVSAGLAASLARPGGNVTGFTIRTDEPSGKRLELLQRAFPNISRVTVMLDPTSVVTQRQLRATEGGRDPRNKSGEASSQHSRGARCARPGCLGGQRRSGGATERAVLEPSRNRHCACGGSAAPGDLPGARVRGRRRPRGLRCQHPGCLPPGSRLR